MTRDELLAKIHRAMDEVGADYQKDAVPSEAAEALLDEIMYERWKKLKAFGQAEAAGNVLDELLPIDDEEVLRFLVEGVRLGIDRYLSEEAAKKT